MAVDFKDHYIGYNGRPNFVSNKVIEDDPIRVIVQKYELIIYTNKGELLGDPDFGCDLYKILWESKISSNNVKNIINQQIKKYIPEISGLGYNLEVSFVENSDKYQEIMVIDFEIKDYVITAFIG